MSSSNRRKDKDLILDVGSSWYYSILFSPADNSSFLNVNIKSLANFCIDIQNRGCRFRRNKAPRTEVTSISPARYFVTDRVLLLLVHFPPGKMNLTSRVSVTICIKKKVQFIPLSLIAALFVPVLFINGNKEAYVIPGERRPQSWRDCWTGIYS